MLSQIGKYALIYEQLLDKKEIENIFKKHCQFDTIKKKFRHCDKFIFEDKELANKIWEKLKFFKNDLIVMQGQRKWHPFAVSNCVKLIKYNIGDFFDWHVDSSKNIGNAKIIFSVTIYLNTVPKKFGGATIFKKNTNILKIQPVKGNALLINTFYGPEHCGQKLKGGEKFILRLDIMGK